MIGRGAACVHLGLGLGIVDEVAGQQHRVRGTSEVQYAHHQFVAIRHHLLVSGVQLGDADVSLGQTGRTLGDFRLNIGSGGQEFSHRRCGGHGEIHNARARADGGQHVLGAGRA